MPLSDIANVQISIADPAPTLPGLGLALLLATVDAGQATAFGADRSTLLSATAWQAQLTALAFDSADAVWVAVSDFFGQQRKPRTLLLGRRLAPVAQVVDVTIAGFADGTYTFNVAGVAIDVVIVGAGSIGDVVTASVSAINGAALPLGIAVTAAPQDADKVRITSDNAGVPILVSVSSTGSAMTAATTTPNSGIAEDLAAIRAEDDSWYALFADWRTTPEILVAAEAIEPLEKIYIAQTDDAAANTAADTDVGTRLAELGYTRTALVYSSSDAQWVDGALLGYMLPSTPGRETFANKTLASVEGDVFSTTTNLLAKNYVWLERIAAFVPPRAVTRHGASVSGAWLDLLLLRDYLAQQLRIAAFEIASADLPYTDIGGSAAAAKVEQTIRDVASLTEAIDLDTLVVTTITKAEQTAGNRAARKWAGIEFAFTATGRIHSLDITGTIGQ